MLTGTPAESYTVDEDNVFVLSNLSDGQAGFYVADLGVTIAQYKAYLKLAEADANELVFDFTPTGISTVEYGSKADNNYYNLNGQRIDRSMLTKGIYIVNGRKVLVR